MTTHLINSATWDDSQRKTVIICLLQQHKGNQNSSSSFRQVTMITKFPSSFNYLIDIIVQTKSPSSQFTVGWLVCLNSVQEPTQRYIVLLRAQVDLLAKVLKENMVEKKIILRALEAYTSRGLDKPEVISSFLSFSLPLPQWVNSTLHTLLHLMNL